MGVTPSIVRSIQVGTNSCTPPEARLWHQFNVGLFKIAESKIDKPGKSIVIPFRLPACLYRGHGLSNHVFFFHDRSADFPTEAATLPTYDLGIRKCYCHLPPVHKEDLIEHAYPVTPA